MMCKIWWEVWDCRGQADKPLGSEICDKAKGRDLSKVKNGENACPTGYIHLERHAGRCGECNNCMRPIQQFLIEDGHRATQQRGLDVRRENQRHSEAEQAKRQEIDRFERRRLPQPDYTLSRRPPRPMRLLPEPNPNHKPIPRYPWN